MLRHSSLLSDFCSWGSWAKGPAVLLSLDRWTNDYVYGEWVLRSDCIPIRIQHQLPSISNSLFAQFAALDHVGPQVRSRVKRRSAFTAFPFWPFCALLKHLGAFIYIYICNNYTFVVFSPPSAAKPQWLQQIDVICAECASAGWCHRIPHTHASSRRPGKAITSATVEISWDVWYDTIIMNQYMIQYDKIWYNYTSFSLRSHSKTLTNKI